MPADDELIACGLVVRPRERVLLAGGHEVALTPREFEIMSRLAEHPGWVFSADQLSQDCTQGDYSPESVSVHVARLRHKLSVVGAGEVVETVRGIGYRLRALQATDGEPVAAGEGVARVLRDALWQLEEAVHEVEHSGSCEQQVAAADALDVARRTVYASLAR